MVAVLYPSDPWQGSGSLQAVTLKVLRLPLLSLEVKVSADWENILISKPSGLEAISPWQARLPQWTVNKPHGHCIPRKQLKQITSDADQCPVADKCLELAENLLMVNGLS